MKVCELLIFLSSLQMGVFTVTSQFPSYSDYQLPDINFEELLSLDEHTSRQLIENLVEIGAVQITNIPKYGQARNRALEGIAACLEADQDSEVIPKVAMPDGSKRLSTASTSRDNAFDPMSHMCGESSASLRSVVAAATNQIFLAIDSISDYKKPVMSPGYKSMVDLMRHGEHLEHLHAYYPPSSTASSPASSEQKNMPANIHSSANQHRNYIPAIDFHVDSGLLIAMTVGYYANFPSHQANGLYMQLPNSQVVRVSVPDDSLIIMMGEGGSKWLNKGGDLPFRAVPHALYMDLPAGGKGSRSWYGKMFLPPPDALVPSPTLSALPIPYKQYRDSEIASSKANSQKQTAYLPAACSPYSDHLSASPSSPYVPTLHQRVLFEATSDCKANQVYCWMRCMDIPANLTCSDPVCFNTQTGEEMPGKAMCPKDPDTGVNVCSPGCPPPSNSTSYCYGTGSSMLMQGFVSTVGEAKGQSECINLFFSEWTLDSAGKFGGACIGVFLLGLIVQAIAKIRMSLSPRNKTFILPARLLPYQRYISVALYGVNVVLGYFAMLVAMTYSVELFCCICAGLIIGYAVVQGGGVGEGGEISADPCCVEGDSEGEHEQLRSPLLAPFNAQGSKTKSKEGRLSPTPPGSDPQEESGEGGGEEFGDCCGGHLEGIPANNV